MRTRDGFARLPGRAAGARSSRRRQALTLIEVAVVLTIIAVLGLVLWGTTHNAKRKAQRINCANNLKQIGIATRLFATDNGDRFPLAVTTNPFPDRPEPKAGGASNWVRDPTRIYQTLSNELATPKVMYCPADPRSGLAPTNFAGTVKVDPPTRWAKSSYFISADGDEGRPQLLLAGDRNITLDGQPVPPGWALLTSNQVLGWTDELHRRQGNVLLSDGSVQGRTGLAPASVEPNRVLVP